MTVDEPKDFELISQLIDKLGENKSWQEYADYMESQDLTNINEGITRNEGYIKSLKKD
jgi:hypothetical protein